ncbi:uncharacterized protein LOC102354795 [Latimeria chalumnae]|uniref:DDE Tnp4 domain-containing protein n=1 Tax=Latimeria chalumnae TaxID=7897 RepID=H3AWE9_LATCH|nr:PREDICTED: putative nuclease HARBI1 [Latimeria chalumnae]|eukprot:XP_006001092.1 PREDICTED: putative nuclease HARBI1 [Latimeria chalumnae]
MAGTRETAGLCLMFYLRLRKQRKQREEDRRRRFLMYRRMKSRQKMNFVMQLFRALLNTHTIRIRRLWTKTRSSVLWNTVIEKAFTNFDWMDNFRVSRATFDFICTKLRPTIQRRDTNMRRAIPVEVRLAMTLWRLGTCCEYSTIEHLFGVSKSTVCIIVRDVCDAIVNILTPEYIHVPTGEQLQEVMNGFEECFGLPQTAGALCSTHIPILPPRENPNDYYNEKGWHSVIMQAVVDHQYCFWDLNIGWPGKADCTYVLLNSELYGRAMKGTLFPSTVRNIGGVDVPIHLLGDLAYPMLPWLLKPFQENGQLTPEQEDFNCRFTSARTVVENAVGRLKGRWRCLLKRNNIDLSFLPTVINACCALHNICELHGDPFDASWNEAEPSEEDLAQPVDRHANCEDNDEAKEIREAVAQALQT